jgi:hypothetical protein
VRNASPVPAHLQLTIPPVAALRWRCSLSDKLWLAHCREELALDPGLTLYHFMLTGMPAAEQQEQQEQLTAAAPLAVAPAGWLPGAGGMVEPNPEGIFPHLPVLQGAEFGDTSLLGAQPGLNYPAPGLSGLAPSSLGQAAPGAAAGWPQLEQPGAADSRGQLGAAVGGPQQKQPASPAASSGSQPAAPLPAAAGHAQSEGHFPLLTVGGLQPVAGLGQYQGKSLVVLGDAEVSGDVYSRGMRLISGGLMGLRAGELGRHCSSCQGPLPTPSRRL